MQVLILRTLPIAALALVALAPPVGAETLRLTPVADTYVDRATPRASYGTARALVVDGSSRKRSYLRFDARLPGNRRIVSARLRLYQADASESGGRVAGVRSRRWDESMTWRTRPRIDGRVAGRFGRVRAGRWYSIDVTRIVRRPRVVSFGLSTGLRDGVKWRSRESSFAPRLVLKLRGRPPLLDGLLTLAPPGFGSSSATDYTSQHRLAKTASGRLLAVVGRHRQGVQLAWRDPRTSWSTATRGRTRIGALNAATGTGDWPASIATARDRSGTEHAWVVYAGRHSADPRPLTLVRLTGLDHPGGPIVGPEVVLDGGHGAHRVDLAFERTRAGVDRAAVVWGRRAADGYELVAGWFSDLGSDRPTLHDVTVLQTSDAGHRAGTLEPSPQGMRMAIRGPQGRAGMFAHPVDAPLDSWQSPGVEPPLAIWPSEPAGMPIVLPAAVAQADGSMVVTGDADPAAEVVTVQRFSPEGEPRPVELELSGYSHPALATDGETVWLFAVRAFDGYVVSRRYRPGDGWSRTDRVEIGSEGGGSHRSVNTLRQVDGRVRFLVRGPAGEASAQGSSVLAFQRRVLP